MIGAYMVLAFSSFILNGGADQSVMEKASITEQVDSSATKEVKNATVLHCDIPHRARTKPDESPQI